MAWIEVHQAVWTHRKTFELAGLLDLDETYAGAHMIRLWTWALDNAPDGSLSTLSDRAIAFGAGWRGDAETFVQALVQVGWLDEDRCIHDWQEYAGRLIERRQSNTERMRVARANRVASTTGGRASHVQRTTVACAGATVPDRTGPNPTGPIPPVASQQPPAEAANHGADAPPKPKRGSKAVRTLAPETLEPNDADYAAGARVGLSREDVDSKAALMLDHWRARGELRADWHASLRTWLANSEKFDQPRASPSHRNGSSRPPPNGGNRPPIASTTSELLMGRNGPIPRR